MKTHHLLRFVYNSELDKYEQGIKKQQAATQTDRKEWEKKIFTQEKELYSKKLEEADAKIIQLEQTGSEGSAQEINQLNKLKEALKRNLIRVEHDLFILNKDKYDLIKFTHIY